MTREELERERDRLTKEHLGKQWGKVGKGVAAACAANDVSMISMEATWKFVK